MTSYFMEEYIQKVFNCCGRVKLLLCNFILVAYVFIIDQEMLHSPPAQLRIIIPNGPD